MAQLTIDTFSDAAPWSALAPDDTNSGEIVVAVDAAVFRFGDDEESLRVEVSDAAEGHRIERALADLDLSELDELRIAVRSNRRADGSAAAPFFFEIRLASAAMGFGDAGNTWSRFIPVEQADVWETVRLSIRELPAAVRSAVDAVRLVCIDDAEETVCHLDDAMAVREEPIADVEAALLQRLHEQFSVGGDAVAAVFYHTEDDKPPKAPNAPAIRLHQYAVEKAGSRVIPTRRRDYSGNGFSLSPHTIAFDLYYEVEVFAESRADKAQILDYLVTDITPYRPLVVNGLEHPLEWVQEDAERLPDGLHAGQAPLHFKVATRRSVGAPTPVGRPPQEIIVDAEPLNA